MSAAALPAAQESPVERAVRGDTLVLGLIALGVALRLWQYLADTSMWFDELSLARNIGERSLSELLSQPLAYHQSAPLGFLAALKVSAVLFGPSELALRLFPFICGLAALLLFRLVAVRLLDGVAVPFAIALYAIAIPMIRYTTELKSYGADVAATLALTVVVHDLCTRVPTLRRCAAAGGVGVLLVLFSQAAVLVLAGLGGVLALRALRDRTARWPLVGTVAVWAVAALGGLLVAQQRMTSETMSFMHQFWQSRQAFLPLPPRIATAAPWMATRFVQFFSDMSFYPSAPEYALLAVFGLAALRRRQDAWILSAPFIITLFAAVAQQYPFRTRLVMFLLPSMLIAAAAAVGRVYRSAAAVHPVLAAALVIVALLPPVYAFATVPPPYAVEPFKPVFAYLEKHRRPGDAVYVYTNAYQAADRYGARYGLPAGTWVAGTCEAHDNRAFLRDVDQFRGRPRLWVVASNVPEFRRPRQDIARYLRTIGVQRDSLAVASLAPFGPVSADLYDLSDTSRLRRSESSTFALQADTLHPLCFDWIRPAASVK